MINALRFNLFYNFFDDIFIHGLYKDVFVSFIIHEDDIDPTGGAA